MPPILQLLTRAFGLQIDFAIIYTHNDLQRLGILLVSIVEHEAWLAFSTSWRSKQFIGQIIGVLWTTQYHLGMSVKEQCDYLRQLVHDALSKHLYDSAVFFADKLVSIGGGSLVDIFSLAQVHTPINYSFSSSQITGLAT